MIIEVPILHIMWFLTGLHTAIFVFGASVPF